LPPQVWAGTTCQKRRQLIQQEGGKAAAAWRSLLLGATTWQKCQLTRDEGGKAAAGLCCLLLVGTTWLKWPLNRHGERKPAQRSVFFLDFLAVKEKTHLICRKLQYLLLKRSQCCRSINITFVSVSGSSCL
jgi:hypothetical protein